MEKMKLIGLRYKRVLDTNVSDTNVGDTNVSGTTISDTNVSATNGMDVECRIRTRIAYSPE